MESHNLTDVIHTLAQEAPTVIYMLLCCAIILLVIYKVVFDNNPTVNRMTYVSDVKEDLEEDMYRYMEHFFKEKEDTINNSQKDLLARIGSLEKINIPTLMDKIIEGVNMINATTYKQIIDTNNENNAKTAELIKKLNDELELLRKTQREHDDFMASMAAVIIALKPYLANLVKDKAPAPAAAAAAAPAPTPATNTTKFPIGIDQDTYNTLETLIKNCITYGSAPVAVDSICSYIRLYHANISKVKVENILNIMKGKGIVTEVQKYPSLWAC